MSELFDLKTVSVPSPRLRWLERHAVKTYKSPYVLDDEEPWSAWAGDFEVAMKKHTIVNGATEEEAITNWAKETGTRLWNEE